MHTVGSALVVLSGVLCLCAGGYLQEAPWRSGFLMVIGILVTFAGLAFTLGSLRISSPYASNDDDDDDDDF